jgi:hypothetical protein
MFATVTVFSIKHDAGIELLFNDMINSGNVGHFWLGFTSYQN